MNATPRDTYHGRARCCCSITKALRIFDELGPRYGPDASGLNWPAQRPTQPIRWVTLSERRVVELAASGMTTRDKLGIKCRAELGRLIKE
jgi:hypothetical protein